MDYIEVVLKTPLYLFHFSETVWGFISSLPYPTKGEVFGSVCIFLILYPVRMVMKAVLPEETVARRYKKRKASVPTKHEHHVASSSVSSLFGHH